MQADIIRRLNDINRAFYATIGADFDATRQAPWAGWSPLLPYLTGAKRVLDVGCGNGRFGLFLRGRVGESVEYHGVDNSAGLLEYAESALSHQPSAITHQLFCHDIIDSALPADLTGYDAIALFGVLHHVPGLETRRALMRDLAARLNVGGVLMVAAWQFMEDPSLRARVAPWPDELVDEIEPGDVLLDWRRGQTAIRYCHHCDDAEFDALMGESGLTVEARYVADGASGRMNLYGVGRRR